MSKSKPPFTIECSKEDNIFTPKEKREEIEVKLKGNYKSLEDCRLQIDNVNKLLIIHSKDKEPLKFSIKRRFFRSEKIIFVFGAERKFELSINFAKIKICEKFAKILWKYKYPDSLIDSVSGAPIRTINHSNHDLAAVFSYEEKYQTVKLITYADEEKIEKKCKIYIDVDKEMISVEPEDSDPVEVLFSQCLSPRYGPELVFEQTNDAKFELQFENVETRKKVFRITKNVSDLKEDTDAEEIALMMVLKKLDEDPLAVEDIKKILRYYAKKFTLFKEENRARLLEIYQKTNFREKLRSASLHSLLQSDNITTSSVNQKLMETVNNVIAATKAIKTEILEIKEEVSEFSNLDSSRKRKADEDATLPPKRNKNELSEKTIIRYPDFKFQCDSTGIPKRKLIIFASYDRTKCYKFLQYGYDSVFYCPRSVYPSRCSSNARAFYCVNEYGETFIKLNGKHTCEPTTYKPEKCVLAKSPLSYVTREFENFFRPARKTTGGYMPRFYIFNPSKNAEYGFVYESNGLRHCAGCRHKGKNVYAMITDRDEEKSIEPLDEDHVCTPYGYVFPKKMNDSDSEGYSTDDADD